MGMGSGVWSICIGKGSRTSPDRPGGGGGGVGGVGGTHHPDNCWRQSS